jgi:deoxyribonuclease V
MASHLGLWIDRPTIGITDRRLVGHYDPPGEKRGDYSVIRYSPQAPGVVLRTRDKVSPLFVSPGHKTDILTAIENTLACCTRFRMPEPLRRAHIEAGKDMRRHRDEHML